MTSINYSKTQQIHLFPVDPPTTEINDFKFPKTYTGLAGFHKYWGKKPTEGISYLIEKLTEEGDIVLDPFLGSGLISLECLLRNRKFIGIDINPFSIEHASFLLNLPSKNEYKQAFLEIENTVAQRINSTYLTKNDKIASHYLWEGNKIEQVWLKDESGRIQIQGTPTDIDNSNFESFLGYVPQHFRNLRFFTNSRINVNPAMTVNDIFTGRAIRNIDLLIEAIASYPPRLRRALLLTLTSASGQMSNMVFAIKNRNKGMNLVKTDKIEVGSWVIGYWLPKTHFEINVWNCFKLRANKLIKTLPYQNENAYIVSNKAPLNIDISNNDAWLIISDCRAELKKIPSEIVSLVCTDPPHSDRIPYLELSELWNSLLGYPVDFDHEIVVSNAKERHKTKELYNFEMTEFFMETQRVLKPNGYIALYFNARDEKSWQYLKLIEKVANLLQFVGCYPISYSATSVVQDNRKGSMKSDYVMVYKKRSDKNIKLLSISLSNIPGWSSEFPKKLEQT